MQLAGEPLALFDGGEASRLLIKTGVLDGGGGGPGHRLHQLDVCLRVVARLAVTERDRTDELVLRH